MWGYADGVSSRTVDVFVGKLRRKLEPDPTSPTRIVTVRGVGYRYLLEEKVHAGAPPTDPLPLIGRDEALEALDAWAQSESRMLTITGPLGVGKSRLARAFARRAEGVYIDLALDPGAVWPSGLVVVDHVDLAGPAARRMVRDRLWSSTDRVVATSRSPLGFQSEEVLRLRPLDTNGARALASLVCERAGLPKLTDTVPKLPFLTIRAALRRDPDDARPRHRSAEGALASMALEPDLQQEASRLAGLEFIDDSCRAALGVATEALTALETAGAVWRQGENLFISPVLDSLQAPREARQTLADWTVRRIQEGGPVFGIPFLGLSPGMLRAALEVATETEQRAWLILGQYDSFHPPDDRSPLEEALQWDLPDELWDRLQEARIQANLMGAHTDSGSDVGHTATARSAIGRALFTRLRAEYLCQHGPYDEAVEVAKEATVLARKSGDRYATGVSFYILAQAQLSNGSDLESVKTIQIGLTFLRGEAAASISANLAVLLIMTSRLDEARDVLQRATAAANITAPGRFMILLSTGTLHLAEGDLDRAEATFRNGLSTEGATEYDHERVRLYLSVIDHLRGNVVDAIRAYQDAQAASVASGRPNVVAGWWEAIAWGDLGLPDEGLDRLNTLEASDVLLEAARQWLRGEEVQSVAGLDQFVSTVRPLMAVRGPRRQPE